MTSEKRVKESALTVKMRLQGYLTCTETAGRVGVSRATVYRWIRNGWISSVDVSGAYYVNWQSVLAHLGDAANVLQLRA